MRGTQPWSNDAWHVSRGAYLAACCKEGVDLVHGAAARDVAHKQLDGIGLAAAGGVVHHCRGSVGASRVVTLAMESGLVIPSMSRKPIVPASFIRLIGLSGGSQGFFNTSLALG